MQGRQRKFTLRVLAPIALGLLLIAGAWRFDGLESIVDRLL
jgi:hypothetical protein